jgi:peptide/nickel transport system permease protein
VTVRTARGLHTGIRRAARRFGPLVALCAVFLFGPLVVGGDPMMTDTAQVRAAPSWAHPFGTDAFGRDVWVRFWHGGARAVSRTLMTAGCALICGLAWAVVVPVRGPARWLFDRAAAALLAIPGLMLALASAAVLGHAREIAVFAAVAFAQAVWLAAVLAERGRWLEREPFMEAARALGAGETWLMRRYRLPALLDAALTLFPAVLAAVLLQTAALYYLGIGGSPGLPDWGLMLYEGRQVYRDAPWVAAAPGLGIALLVACALRAGDARPSAGTV